MLVDSGRSTLVFDCGHYKKARPISWERLVREAAFASPIDSIAISHIHYDHYSGFLRPNPYLRDVEQVVLGRMPEIVAPEGPKLRLELLARMLSFDPAATMNHGPPQVDLVRRIKESAPNAVPNPVSAGETFRSAGTDWRVLWPPSGIEPNQQFMSTVLAAIKAYDEAAKKHTWLKDRLAKTRNSETFAKLIEPHEESQDPPAKLDDDTAEGSPREQKASEESSVDDLLKDAKDKLSKAANFLSLIVEQRDDPSILLTGDPLETATRIAFKGMDRNYVVALTPHHGGKDYVPGAVSSRSIRSGVWISSGEGDHRSHISDEYNKVGGIHLRTDEVGDVSVHVRDGVPASIRTGIDRYPRRFIRQLLGEAWF